MPEKPYQVPLEDVKEALGILAWMPGYDKVAANVKGLDCFARAIRRFVDDREMNHQEFGLVVPLEWLIDHIGETCEFFPKPIQMRMIYERHFPPLDGRAAVDLVSGIET